MQKVRHHCCLIRFFLHNFILFTFPVLPYAGRHERFPNETIPNVKIPNVKIPNVKIPNRTTNLSNNPVCVIILKGTQRGKGAKLGEGCSKVRLSRDRLTILSFHLAYNEGKGTKLGEGIRDFYVQDFYHFQDSGFLHSGLFCSGKVHGALRRP